MFEKFCFEIFLSMSRFKCTKSIYCSNKDRHRGRCNRKLLPIDQQTCKQQSCKQSCNKRKAKDDPWFANIQNTEINRLRLFGIRIEFSKKIRRRVEKRKGTVINYLPATQEHVVQFDDSNKRFNFFLLHEKNWTRIPWFNNTLDNSTTVGEISNDSYISFGPDCPRCAAFLGVGIEAWSRCHMCGLDEPGACLWSMH